jgi:hypothetical protein
MILNRCLAFTLSAQGGSSGLQAAARQNAIARRTFTVSPSGFSRWRGRILDPLGPPECAPRQSLSHQEGGVLREAPWGAPPALGGSRPFARTR